MPTTTRALTRLITIATTAFASGCSNLMFSIANAPTHFGSYKRTVDLAYSVDHRQRLDVYAPEGAQRRPIVIFWYGGSWVTGSKTNYRFVGAAFAARGFITVIPDYRLYPQIKFPTFVEDGAQAVAWVQQHAHEFGGDPTRIVLMGHSAGAHEAALLALDRRYLQQAGANPAFIVGLIALSGPYELTPNSELLHTIFAEPYQPNDWQPVRYVDAHSPPALLFHGGNDEVVIHEHANRLESAYARAGVPLEKIIYTGRGHAAPMAGFASIAPSRLPTLEKSVQFIERVTASFSSSKPHPSPATSHPISSSPFPADSS